MPYKRFLNYLDAIYYLNSDEPTRKKIDDNLYEKYSGKDISEIIQEEIDSVKNFFSNIRI